MFVFEGEEKKQRKRKRSVNEQQNACTCMQLERCEVYECCVSTLFAKAPSV